MEIPASKTEWEQTFCDMFTKDEKARADIRVIAQRLHQLAYDSDFDFSPGYLGLSVLDNYNGTAEKVLGFLRATKNPYIQAEISRYEAVRNSTRTNQGTRQTSPGLLEAAALSPA
ncbi:MAG: hypothetical protein AABX17_03400 [Nanoarchaeota archaeon]